MSTPTHIVIGAVVAKFAFHHGYIVDPTHVYLISIVAANVPDSMLLPFAIHKTTETTQPIIHLIGSYYLFS